MDTSASVSFDRSLNEGLMVENLAMLSQLTELGTRVVMGVAGCNVGDALSENKLTAPEVEQAIVTRLNLCITAACDSTEKVTPMTAGA